MTTIRFTEAQFFDPKEGRIELETRFKKHLRWLRCKKIPPENLAVRDEADQSDTTPGEDLMEIIGIGHDDQTRISRRVARLIERRKAASGLEHLRSDDRAKLEVLRDGARLITIADEHQADVIAATLHGEMPWMGSATETVWHAMRRSVREGLPGLRIPPLLLDGPPGIGKSHWARRIGELLSLPTTVIEATGENASFGIVGSQRGWGGSYPGRLIQTCLQTRVANPVIVIDEVEKAGRATSTNGQAFGLAEALLPLFEPLTARRWSCPYYQVTFDMSWVIWVLTANDARLLPEPLRNRCPPIRLRQLARAELQAFVRREGAKRALSEVAIDAICEILAHPTLKQHHLSLRVAGRMLNRAADMEQGPRLH